MNDITPAGAGDPVPQGDDEPVDDDIARITDYLAGELDDDEAEQVERQIEEDQAFYEKVAPVMRLWNLPVSFREVLARAAEQEPPPTAPSAAVVATTPVISLAAERDKRWLRTTLRSPRKVARLLIQAAACILMLPQVVMNNGVDMLFSTGVRNARLAASVLPLPGATGPGTATVYETARGETREFTLADGSHVLLRPHSQFTWRPLATSPSASIATIKGEAVITVASAWHPMYVGTPFGTAVLFSGPYAIRWMRGGGETQLTVGHGWAWMKGKTGTSWTFVRAAGHGHMTDIENTLDGSGIERVDGGVIAQYPKVTP